MKKLLLVDAYSQIYRAYYAFIKNPRINSKGQNTSAVFGFINTLEDVIKREQPTHVAVVFDPSGPTFRHEAYEQYKAQRPESPEDIKRSVPLIKQVVEAMRIPVIEVAGYEADDVVGTLAKMADEKGDFETLMLTSDKDYGQLVSDKSFIYKPRFGGQGYDKLGVPEVLEKWGIQNTAQVIDLLGLMGDSSDNIPGCPGIGEKTAVKLLNDFGSIDNLLAHTDQLKGALQSKIADNKDKIEFSRFLATIKIDVPVEFDEKQLLLEEPDKEKLIELYTELEFRSFVAKLTGKEPEKAPKKSVKKVEDPLQGSLFGDDTEVEINETEQIVETNFATAATTPHNYKIVNTDSELNELLSNLLAQKSFCFDTETNSIDALNAELVGMSFAITPHEAFYVPCPTNRTKTQAIVDKLRPAFEENSIDKIGQNLKFDLLVLENYGVRVQGRLFDTMVAHYLLNPELYHNMDYLAEILLNYHTIHIDELIGAKGKNQLNMRQVPVEQIAEYAAEDADITLQLFQVLQPKIAENNLNELMYNIEMPLVRVLAQMERNGVLIDDFALVQSSDIMTNKMLEIEREIQKIAGNVINISSPKQIGELLFDQLKIAEKPRKTKTGQYVTDEETLESLRSKHEIVGKILDYRGLKKLLSTYIDALPKLIDPKTGKIHTSFNQTITATGRLSSSNPNLQNIPVRDEQGREIRKAFIADEGCVFLSADYSQVELRIMAHLSGDKNMIAAFNNDYDIHAATAANIYKVPIAEVTSDMRRKAKTANFGIIYGISAFGLAERLQISRTEAKQLIDGYFETFPEIRQYMDSSIEKARANGYVETIFHRKRFLPDINSRNANVRNFAERNAINAPIQGTAADIIKIAMVRIQQRLNDEHLKTQLILQVHDELNFSVPTAEIDRVTDIVRYEMEHAYPLTIPLKVDIGIGQNWLEAH